MIADCYAQLGRPNTIDLLDDMKSLGFKRSTLAALSFGITDIRSPDTKATILEAGQKKADKHREELPPGCDHRAGTLRPADRLWGHARKQVTDDLMDDLANDYRDDEGKPLPPRPAGS